MARKLYRPFRGFARTFAIIRETADRMNAILDGSNKKSDAFWPEFKRGFPEMQLDDVKTQDI
ncbi:MAG: hypothetical protein A2992_08750 [Elusimicrobia bacterium RIFCSPLOWO2_01_FULL_59_12]|nr:MAG: hypothetical protein A2992_08750 [Elusimicrobia bacterium RIFCSPLOWO2_01_FULL_59_12]